MSQHHTQYGDLPLYIGGEAYRPEDFMRLKDATGHDCPFCQDYESLKHNQTFHFSSNE